MSSYSVRQQHRGNNQPLPPPLDSAQSGRMGDLGERDEESQTSIFPVPAEKAPPEPTLPEKPAGSTVVRNLIRGAAFAAVLACWLGGFMSDDTFRVGIGMALALVVGTIGIATDPDHSKWKKGGLAALLVAVCAVSGAVAAWRNQPKEPPAVASQPAVTPQQEIQQAQDADVRSIMAMTNGKSDFDLQQEFDLVNTFKYNMAVQRENVPYIDSGHWKDFSYNKYVIFGSNNDLVLSLPHIKLKVDQHGLEFTHKKNDVYAILPTLKYQQEFAELQRLQNSPTFPPEVKAAISAFSSAVSDDLTKMTDVMTVRMHQDHRYFTEADGKEDAFRSVVYTDYIAQRRPLKPAADNVIAALSKWSR